MLGYALVGTNDIERARTFFGPIFAALDMARLHDSRHMVYWGSSFTGGAVGVCRPFNRNPASSGNGTMLAVHAPSRAAVDVAHRVALQQGAVDKGQPGVRSGEDEATFYGAYFRDPDGNKFCLFRLGVE